MPWARGYVTSDRTGRIGNLVFVTPEFVKTGFKLVDWEEKIAAKIDATTSYTVRVGPTLVTGSLLQNNEIVWRWVDYEWYVDSYQLFWTEIKGFPHRDYLTVHQSSTQDYSPEIALSNSIAKLAFLRKMRELNRPWTSLTFLGELRETIGMIRHPLRGILKTTRSYRARVRRLAKVREHLIRRYGHLPVERRRQALMLSRLDQMMTQSYLQWTYGVAPLIEDLTNMFAAAKALCDNEGSVTRIVVTSPKINGKASGGSYLERVNNSRAVFMKTVQEIPLISTRYIGAVRSDMNPPGSLDRLLNVTGANLREFVPTFYELLPFSFLVDYFTSVGDVVNGAFTAQRNLIYACSIAKMKSSRLQLTVPLPSMWGVPRQWPSMPLVAASVYTRHNRVKANLSVSFTDFRFTIPGTGEILNTLVLLRQLLRS